jgi:hypothetical protein
MSSSTRQRRASVSDVVEVVKQYALQETVGPLKGLGRWIGAGIAGAICLGLGFAILLLGLLRLIQDVGADVFDGDLNFIPYLIVLAVALLLVVIVASRIKRTGLSSREGQR